MLPYYFSWKLSPKWLLWGQLLCNTVMTGLDRICLSERLEQRPETPTMLNEDKHSTAGIWEYQVAPLLCRLMPSMHSGRWAVHVWVCVCCLLWSNWVWALVLSLWCTSTHAWNQVVSVFTCAFLFVKVHPCVLSEPAPNCPHLLKSFSVSSSSSPWPRRRRWRSSMSRAMIFSNSWFKAWCRVVATK